MLFRQQGERMAVALLELPRPYQDFFLIPLFQERSLGDLPRFQPRQPLSGVFDFGQARVGVFPEREEFQV